MKLKNLQNVIVAAWAMVMISSAQVLGADVVKRVVFAKGKNTAIYKNKLPGLHGD